jgi:TatD DNase family protein
MHLFNIHSHKIHPNQTVIFNAELENMEDKYHSSGVHPWKSDLIFSLEKLRNNLNHPNCLALGEVGLDSKKGPSLIIQQEVFEKQLGLAEEFAIPVIIHAVGTFNKLFVTKKKYAKKQQWIIHGFNKPKMTKEILKEGFYLSIGAAVLSRNDLKDVIRTIPDDKLFLETDDSEDKLVEIYEEVAKLRGVNFLTLQQIVQNNFINTFQKWQPG